VKRSLGLLIGGSLAFWAVVAYPAYLVWGEPAVVFSAVAALLCLVPTTVTLIWCHKALRGGSPEQQLLAVMGGMAVRLVVVIGAGLALYFAAPYFHRRSFWLWVIVFYLVTLSVEIGLIVARQSTAERPQNH
jgi:hypothetical protein